MDIFWTFIKGLLVLIQVILVFNLLIVVHEWGHFLAARWRGLKIDKFQIWFGKPLWKKRINGVQWGLGSIPAGGFVALPQMAPMEMIEGSGDDRLAGGQLTPITPLDKIIVAFAGPLFSLGLALVFGVLVWLVGYPERTIKSTVIGFVQEGSPAEAAGLLPGDEIVSINGDEVKHFGGMLDSVMERISMSEGEKITVSVRRPGVEGLLAITSGFELDGGGMTRRPGLRRIGIGSLFPLQVKSVVEHSPAQIAGLRPGDRIVSANGSPLYSDIPLGELTQKGEPIELGIERDGSLLTISVTPARPIQPEESDPKLGIQWDISAIIDQEYAHPNPFSQVATGAKLIWRTVSAVASPKTDVSIKHLSGPVGIGTHYFNFLSEPDGWRMVLWFSVILNVNLAILNMLPFPVLDGGHIVLALAEMIRGKTVNLRLLEYVQAGCAIALISFMLYVTWFDGADTVRNVGGAFEKKSGPVEVKFAPPVAP